MEAKRQLAPELHDLRAVLAARFSSLGQLIECNAGFQALMESSLPDHCDGNVSFLFIQPSWEQIVGHGVDNSDKPYFGILTVGSREGRTWTVNAKVVRDSDSWVLIAEHDVEALEKVREALSSMNRDLARTQRELAQAMRELTRKNKLIEELTVTDALTGLGNRRRFDERLSAEIARARRDKTAFSMVMLDIDYFKAVNDSLGHDTGDLVLTQLSRLLALHVRAIDTAIRFGGEEFVVLMPGACAAEAAQTADRLRRAFEAHFKNVLASGLTASFGVAELLLGELGQQLLQRSDAAMYRAKQQGRNCVVVDACS